MTDEIPSSVSISAFDTTVIQSSVQYENDNYNLIRNNETINENRLPSIDEMTEQETNSIEKLNELFVPDYNDSDDDDDIQVIIRNYDPQMPTSQTNRLKTQSLISTNSIQIRNQPTDEHDMEDPNQDEEKPWKKPGADVTDYFNYGFTEETWTKYCDRQRRLRAENNLARLTINHIPRMPSMMGNHRTMGRPLIPQPIIIRPMNMQVVPRPMNVRTQDGRINTIGTTDQTSRRTMIESSAHLEHLSFIDESSYSTDQSSNKETVHDFISVPTNINEHVSTCGLSHNNSHHIATIGTNRVPMIIPVQPGIPYQPPFPHQHPINRPQYFPPGSIMVGMHGERPPQPYLIPQQTWNRNPMVSYSEYQSGSIPSETTKPTNTNNERGHSSHSATPDGNRSTSITNDHNEKSSKEDHYKERNDRNHHSSSSNRSHHQNNEHEYEHHMQTRHQNDDRHHSSHHRSTTKTTNLTTNESSSISNNQSKSNSHSRSPSSSHHSHHRKSSKRSRHDSSNERNSRNHYH